MTTIGTLRGHYGDDIVANMIIAAKKVPNGLSAAKTVEDDVFKQLKIDDAGNKLLESPLFSIYTKFMDNYNKVNPGKEVTMISALTKSYNDEDLSKILESAKKVRSTETIATKLQTDQIKYWLANKHSPDKVFMLLRLHGSVDGLLTKPLLGTWTKYMNAFNAKYPSKKTSMADTLSTNFSEIVLLQMLVAAKNDSRTKQLATELQTSLFNKWVMDKTTPERMSTILDAVRAPDDTIVKFLQTYTAKFKEKYG